MRKPHTIPKSIFGILTPSDEIDITGRTIKYEDFTWADRIPKPLRFVCLDSIADNFAKYPKNLFEWITPMNIEYLVETLSVDLPIPIVIHVPDGEYWRRVAASTMTKFVLRPKDTEARTLKSIYLTKHVSETISNVVPDIMDEPRLTELLVSCSPYVTALDCKHLRIPESLSYKWALEEFNGNPGDPVHVDLGYVLTYLENVSSVSLVYGPAEITFGSPDLYKFNVSDMDALGYGLVVSKHLTSLAITNSDLDSVKFSRLLPYLMKCHGLEELNLSFCKLHTSGGTSVAHYAKTAKRLRLLNVRGNDIGPDAVEILAIVALWRRNNDYPAMELNLSMNNINDIGAKYLASALGSGTGPFTKLWVRNCNISEIGGVNIVQSLAYDRGLRDLALDNNPLTSEVAILLHTVMRTNQNITYLSVHNCNFSNNMTNFLGSVATYNKYDKRSKFNYADFEDLYDELEKENVSEELKIEEEEDDVDVNY